MKTTNQLTHDPLLPKLSSALDSSVMQLVFQKELFGDTDESQPKIEQCHIFHTRYKRGRYCMLCYRLTIRDPHTAHMHEQILSARMFVIGGAPSRFHKAQSQKLVSPKFGKPLSLIPDLHMVVWAFPNDRKLSGLPGLMDTDYLQEVALPQVVTAHLGPGWKVEELTPELIHYVGEHTCTICVTTQLSHITTKATKILKYFGKTYYDNGGEAAYQTMTALWTHNIQSASRVPMAQPLWYDNALRTLWQSSLEGKTLIEYDLLHTNELYLLKQAATTVAALHQTSVSCGTPPTLEEQVRQLTQVHPLLVEVQPECHSLLTQLIDRLVNQASSLKLGPTGTLHGDLHLQNCFVTSNGVALIDLDNICIGYPAHDIGSFLANLYYHALVKQKNPSQASALGQVFLQEYERHIPWKLSQKTLAWFVAVSLVTERAYRCATRLKNGRLDLVPDLLTLANNISCQNNPFTGEDDGTSNSVHESPLNPPTTTAVSYSRDTLNSKTT